MIDIDEAVLARIRGHGVRAFPREACGVLLGSLPEDAGRAARIVRQDLPLDNSREAGEQYHRFVITPADYLRAERRAEQLGLDIVGFYHSHPNHPSVPSDYDREHAFPGLSYIVTEVRGTGPEHPLAVRTQSWVLAPDRSAFQFEADLDRLASTGQVGTTSTHEE